MKMYFGLADCLSALFFCLIRVQKTMDARVPLLAYIRSEEVLMRFACVGKRPQLAQVRAFSPWGGLK